MFRSKTLAKGAAVAAFSAALLGASPAFGDAGENVTSSYGFTRADGVKITWVSAWSYQSSGNKTVSVKDGYGDSHSVYTLYDRKNTTGLRLDNDNGAGSTVTSGSSATNYVVKVTACIDIQAAPDQCGPDDRPGDGR
jgi:hypothetical protein